MSETPPNSVLQLTALNPDFRDDPHVMLDALRSQRPVMRDPMAGEGEGEQQQPGTSGAEKKAEPPKEEKKAEKEEAVAAA